MRHIDTDQTGGTAIDGTGAQRLAGDGVLEEEFGDGDEQDGYGKDPQMLRQQRRPGDGKGGITGERRQGMGILPPQEHGNTAQQNTAADGDNHQTQRGRLAQRPDRQAFEEDTDKGGADNGQQHGDNQGELPPIEKIDPEHPPDHDQLPLGEIDDPGGVVDDGETDADQGIDGPGGEAGKEVLGQLLGKIHENSLP